MPRYRLLIEYDGSPYAGWQRQPHAPSVQESIEEALEKFCGERAKVYCSGRTDAGVHALGQVAHFDIAKEATGFRVMQALNEHLRPQPIAILHAEVTDDDFNARTSAKKRHYVYRIANRRARLGLEQNRAWHVPTPLDEAVMQEAAAMLIGKHDFTSFRDSACQAKSPIKTLERLSVERQGDEIRIEASARSFLHHQVRNMVGTLVWVGKGKWKARDVGKALAAKDRRAGGPTAPPDGLYFVKVDY